MTRRVLWRGKWWMVPTRIRNDAYCKARDRGMSHDEACQLNAPNWMCHRPLGALK